MSDRELMRAMDAEQRVRELEDEIERLEGALKYSVEAVDKADKTIQRLEGALRYTAYPHYGDRKYELMAAAREALAALETDDA